MGTNQSPYEELEIKKLKGNTDKTEIIVPAETIVLTDGNEPWNELNEPLREPRLVDWMGLGRVDSMVRQLPPSMDLWF